MTHPFEFPEAVYCTLGEALSAQAIAKFPFFFTLKWCIWSTFLCLPAKFFSHKFSWWPSRGFPASVSMITFKWGVGGDPLLSVTLASGPKVCSGLREGPESSSSQFQSPSEPCPVSGGASWRWFGLWVEPWEVLGCVRLWLSCFTQQIRLH